MKPLTLLFYVFVICNLQAQVTNLNVSFPGNFTPYGLETTINSPTGVSLSWNAIEGATYFQAKGRILGTTPFGTFATPNTFKNIGGLTPGQTYEWKVRAACTSPATSTGATGFSELSPFTLPAERINMGSQSLISIESIYPIPAKEHIYVDIRSSADQTISLKMVDVFGKTVVEKERYFTIGDHSIELNTSHLQSGFYFVDVGHSSYPLIIIK